LLDVILGHFDASGVQRFQVGNTADDTKLKPGEAAEELLGAVATYGALWPTVGVCATRVDGTVAVKAPCAVLTQLEQFGGSFYDFASSGASQIKGLDRARA
jgi:hypothetical protein